MIFSLVGPKARNNRCLGGQVSALSYRIPSYGDDDGDEDDDDDSASSDMDYGEGGQWWLL